MNHHDTDAPRSNGSAVLAETTEPRAETPKVPKAKLVRDSFTIPKAEYATLNELRQRATRLAAPAKKSELLRAGIELLKGLSDQAFLAALAAVPNLKTGRPKKDGEVSDEPTIGRKIIDKIAGRPGAKNVARKAAKAGADTAPKTRAKKPGAGNANKNAAGNAAKNPARQAARKAAKQAAGTDPKAKAARQAAKAARQAAEADEEA